MHIQQVFVALQSQGDFEAAHERRGCARADSEGELALQTVPVPKSPSHFSISAGGRRTELNGTRESGSLHLRVRRIKKKKKKADAKDQSAKSRHILQAAVILIAPVCGHL